jgi:hypothetical protein
VDRSEKSTHFYSQHRLYCALGACLLLALLLLAIMRLSRQPSPSVAPPPVTEASPTPRIPPASPFRFTDVTAAAGIQFNHFAGMTDNKWYPETIGAGVGFFDYDSDGHPDLLLINGTYLTNHRHTAEGDPAPTMRLYRNQGDGTFVDVTQAARLNVPLYGMGMAAADYDNDGDNDLLVTGYLRNLFFINNGDKTFTEATQRVGIQDGAWNAGAAFFDYDVIATLIWSSRAT